MYPLSNNDKDAFSESLQVVALRIPASKCSRFMKRLRKRFTFSRPKLPAIIRDPEEKAADGEGNATSKKPAGGGSRLLLLNESVKSLDLVDLPESEREFVLAEGASPVWHTLKLGYEFHDAATILRKVLPADVVVPSAFAVTGHIAHFNLRDELLPYKYTIGQVILDKTPNIRTVVNKLGKIENEFRVFKMELLAGDDDFEAEMKEHGCRFVFNFREVYWNSRLSSEHNSLCNSFEKGQSICDMMCGVGPFAVPAARHRQCVVYANDLNPSSYKYLCENVKRNKVSKHVRCFNMDARAFFREMRSRQRAKAVQASSDSSDADKAVDVPDRFDHVVMNLPATALEFLDVFHDAYTQAEFSRGLVPLVHCYCFSGADDPKADVVQRAERAFGSAISGADVRLVRNVAPKKDMFCLTFRPAPAPAPSSQQHSSQDAAEVDGMEGSGLEPRVATNSEQRQPIASGSESKSAEPAFSKVAVVAASSNCTSEQRAMDCSSDDSRSSAKRKQPPPASEDGAAEIRHSERTRDSTADAAANGFQQASDSTHKRSKLK